MKKKIDIAAKGLRLCDRVSPWKANVVADAIAKKTLSMASDGGFLAELQLRPTLLQQIKEKQASDEELVNRVHQVEQGV
ncbi:integrase [Gossypium australe]|uniref:Integrase n=1 Tax=Gossypium australe TaxID=47621 RepID=A0A5B6WS15_9ROSI|nr:integrase [Gossypium australe]